MTMKKEERENDAVSILHRRYIGDDAERKASLQEERVNAEVARMIYDLRKGAGLTQKELAKLIGTTQSVVSRLEDADYNGHSLSMLSRIAKALNRALTVSMDASKDKLGTLRLVFQEVVRGLRREKGLGIEQFAEKAGIELPIGYQPKENSINIKKVFSNLAGRIIVSEINNKKAEVHEL